jgi:tetratricopeptide (TPR) repeat protein
LIEDQRHNYIDMMADQTAAFSAGDETVNAHIVCYGYYQLQDYDDAVRKCGKVLDRDATNMSAHYWRAMAYGKLGKADAALQDLTEVANSKNALRMYAAIEMSMNHFSRNDTKGALDILNSYTYL